MDKAEGVAAVALDAAIDARAISPFQYWVVALASAVLFLDGFDIQSMALTVPAIAEQWQLAHSEFGIVLSAALIGMTVSAATLAPLGDRYGRRPVIIASLLVIGAGSLATAAAGSLIGLTVGRAITGIGMGMSMANAVAIVSEFAPARRRAILVTIAYSSVALGAFCAGFIAPWVTDAAGWRGIFHVGGWLPVLLAIFLLFCLPESPGYQLAAAKAAKARRTLSLMGIPPAQAIIAPRSPGHGKGSVANLFVPGLGRQTLLLWMLFSLTLFTMYLLISWLPALLSLAGFPRSSALRMSALIQAGGIVGGLILSVPADRGRIFPALLVTYACSICLMSVFAWTAPRLDVWGVSLFLLGFGTAGTQVAITALAVVVYPPPIRATGLGWSMMAGRIGAICSAFAGGFFIEKIRDPGLTLALLGIPVALSALVLLALARARRAQDC